MTEKKRTPQKKHAFLDVIRKKYVAIPAAIMLFCALSYLILVFSGIPFIEKWRSIYIETAMTTADHQWLATAFLPRSVIDRVMSKKTPTDDIIGGSAHLTETAGPAEPPETAPADSESGEEDGSDTSAAESGPTPSDAAKTDILGQLELEVGGIDHAGYKVTVNDLEQGIVVSEVVESGYRGLVMLIDDPSRVYLGTTTMKDTEGLRIRSMMNNYGAIAGINASGFSDPNDSGTGGEVMGMSYDGEFWGEYVDFYGSILMTSDDRLVVGNVRDWEKYDIRAGIQFGPVLIADGDAAITGTGGYGIQPRTAIGQREDGVIIFLVIDGRQVGWSLGCTMEDLISILTKYGAVNAACCDGGSSSVLAYNGEVLNRNSSANPAFGRRLPNAFLVAPRESDKNNQ